jgi:N-acetylneuraminic acid mutarotase
MAALDGAVYLFSGIELVVGANGKPQATYLTDAYRYRPDQGWEKLPDLPRSAIAAPSPAPVSVTPSRIFIMGGVDGRLVGKQPRDTRVPDDIIYFDLRSQTWKSWPERWPDPVVNVTTVHWAGEWILVSGETMSGQRTPHVWSWMPEGSHGDTVIRK